MWTDVVDLNEFYGAPLGKAARHLIRLEIRRIWPDVRGLHVAGIGYATPYLKQFRGEAARTIAVMPAYQGVTRWPREGLNAVALGDEAALPFDDSSIDRLLYVHAVENTEHLRVMMREAWRVLAGQGRLLVVVPSRRGVWCRSERTPFGHGKPYSKVQLQKLLKEVMFEPTQLERALYMPPVGWRVLLHSAPAWERIGRRWFPRFGGVLVMEAKKQIYAATPQRRISFRRPLVVMPNGAKAPGAAMQGQ